MRFFPHQNLNNFIKLYTLNDSCCYVNCELKCFVYNLMLELSKQPYLTHMVATHYISQIT